MIWKVRLTTQAEKDLIFWKRSNKKIFEQCVTMLKFLQETPTSLIPPGNPEWLKGNLCGCMSRRITKKDRCVYHVNHEQKEIKVLQLRFHYDDN